MGDGPRFAVLGPVRGWRGDAELGLGAPQQRAMLAFLLLQEGRAAAAQTIMEALWGDRPPERALGTVRTYASRLRSAVETDRARPAVLVTAGDGYQLVLPDDALDATRFRARLAAADRARTSGDLATARDLVLDALALWTGAPLDELPGPFARAQRARLDEWRLAASQTRFELDLALGLHEEAVAELAVLAAEHPLREAFPRLLMLALHRSGRRDEAIEVFERSRSLLDAELGLDPGPGLVELRRAIAAGPYPVNAAGAYPANAPGPYPISAARPSPPAAAGPSSGAAGPPSGIGPGSASGTAAGTASAIGAGSLSGTAGLSSDTAAGPSSSTAAGTASAIGAGSLSGAAETGSVAAGTASGAAGMGSVAAGTASGGGGTGSVGGGRASAVAELPTDLIDFTGRDRQVAALVGTLSEGPAVVAVHGPVGVGKSALALHVAHLVRDSYPDGQLYADLRRSDPGMLLSDFLRTLGVTAETVSGRAERAALLRSALRGRRMLLLLDNAPDAESLRPLLPGGDCSVLVTCRGRPTCVPLAVELAEFTEDEAVALFGRVAGRERVAREPEAVAEAVELCGRLPLAVRILAARLASRPGWTAGSLVRRLADEGRRLAELKVGTLGVEALFNREYARLDAGRARAFRLLARPGEPSFSLEDAARVLGWRRDETAAVLADLTGSGLLTTPSPGRFRYPDLLHLYARHLP